MKNIHERDQMNEMNEMDEELSKVINWFRAHGRARKLVHAGDIPPTVGLENISLYGDKSELKAALKKLALPSSRSYYLGTVTTGVFGMQGSASHRVVRQKGGTKWKLYVSGPDFYEGELYIDEIRSSEITSYTESLGYELTIKDWISMGWRPE